MNLKHSLLIMFSMLSLFVNGQQAGVLPATGYFASAFEKVVLGNKRLVIFGVAMDTSVRNVNYRGAFCIPTLFNYPHDKIVELRNGIAQYIKYGQGYCLQKDKILQVDDSTFCYTYFTIDTGEEYKTSKNWIVLFNNQGDSIRTVSLKTENHFIIRSSLFIKETNEIFVFGEDTAYYEYGIQSLYKIDSNGNVKWRKRISGDCITNFKSLLPAYDSENVLLVGTIAIRRDINDPCYSKYYFRAYNKFTGALVSEYISEDSLELKQDARIDNAKLMHNGNVLSLGLTEDIVWGSANPQDYWDTYSQEQHVMLFNHQTGKLLKRRFIKDLLSGYKYFTIIHKIIPLKTGGTLLMGEYIDTLPLNGDLSHSRYGVTLMKLSDNLEMKWVRNITCYDGLFRSFISDAVEDSVNGFWTVGAVTDTNFLQKGWVLHLDSFGCAIPGCQLKDGIQNVTRNGTSYLKVYPNPAADAIHIQISNLALDGDRSVLLINALGETIATANVLKDAKELKLDVTGVKPGLYYLLLTANGNLLDGVKVLVNVDHK